MLKVKFWLVFIFTSDESPDFRVFLPFSTVTNLAEISWSHKLSKIPHNNYKKKISFWPINSFYFYDKVISLLQDKD